MILLPEDSPYLITHNLAPYSQRVTFAYELAKTPLGRTVLVTPQEWGASINTLRSAIVYLTQKSPKSPLRGMRMKFRELDGVGYLITRVE